MDKLIHSSVIFSEDFYMPYNALANISKDGMLQIFLSNDHNWFVFSIIDVIMARYLPEIFKIHPQLFAENILSIFVFSIFLLFCAVFSENLTKFFKNKLYFSVGILLVFPAVIYCFDRSIFLWAFYNIMWIYGYLLLPVFAFLLMQEFELFYIFGENIDKKKNIIYCLIILTAISNDFFRIVFIIALFIGYLLHNFLLKNINHKKFWIKYSIFTILNSFLFFSPQYIELTQDRVKLDYFKNIEYFINYLLSFLIEFNDKIIFRNIYILTVLFISLIIIDLSVKDKCKKVRFYIYSFSLIIAVFIFVCLMFFVNDYNDINILDHSGLRFLFLSIMLFLICSSISFILKYSENNKVKNTVKISMLLTMFLFFHKDIFYFNWVSQHSNQHREDCYILEKVYLLNRYKNDTIFMYNRDINPDFTGAEVYLTHLYGPNKYDTRNDEHMKRVKEVCTADDEWDTCRKNMIKKAEEFGYTITEKEIKEHNFSELYKER